MTLETEHDFIIQSQTISAIRRTALIIRNRPELGDYLSDLDRIVKAAERFSHLILAGELDLAEIARIQATGAWIHLKHRLIGAGLLESNPWVLN